MIFQGNTNVAMLISCAGKSETCGLGHTLVGYASQNQVNNIGMVQSLLNTTECHMYSFDLGILKALRCSEQLRYKQWGEERDECISIQFT
jgi:hypothetical protein